MSIHIRMYIHTHTNIHAYIQILCLYISMCVCVCTHARVHMYPHKHLTTLQACADKLAAKKDWPSLYNPEALRNTSVPTAAAMYYDDIYVDRLLSEQTAALVGSAPGATPIKVWVTNEYQHTGIRDDG